MAKKLDFHKLEALLADDIEKKIQASFCILLSNYTELSKDGHWTCAYAQPATLKEIQAYITASIPKIPEILKHDSEQLDACINVYLAYKKTVIAIERVLQAYSLELEFLSFCRRQEQNVRFFGQEANDELDIQAIYNDCMAYVYDPERPHFENMRKSKVMACFPVKMTRERYYDYIRNSTRFLLDFASLDDARPDKAFINEYVAHAKFMFKPDVSENYGVFFPEIAKQIAELRAAAPEVAGSPPSEALFTKMNAIIDELTLIHDFLLLLFECLNGLVTISALSVDLETLFNDNFELKDAYYTIVEHIDKQDSELFLDNVSEVLYRRLDALMDSVFKLNSQCDKLLDHPSYGAAPSELDGISRTRALVTALFYENLNDAAFKADKASAENDEAKDAKTYMLHKTEDIVDHIKQCLANEPIGNQRFLRQFFMNHIICPLDKDEFSKYILDGLASATDHAQRMAIAANLAVLLETAGFTLDDREDDSEHDHGHVHDEHCGCGHDEH